MKNDYEIFREIIREIIKDEISKQNKNNGLETKYTGTVTKIKMGMEKEDTSSTDPYKQQCNIDLVFTQIGNVDNNDGILNKSGQFLSIGDTVTVYETSGSNFSNCYIGLKNSM